MLTWRPVLNLSRGGWTGATGCWASVGNGVGVGIMVAHHPLHGSGRADFPHPALASGDDAKPPQRIGMTDAGRRQPAVDEPPHPVPQHAAVLAAARQCAMPEPPDLEPKPMERRL